jgi:hypothetical protein
MQMHLAKAFVALSVLFGVFIWYYFFFAPKKGAAIASAGGKDPRKWNFYIWSFGLFAVTYLFFALDDIDRRQRRSLIGLMLGYVMIFFGAICIDTVFDLRIR